MCYPGSDIPEYTVEIEDMELAHPPKTAEQSLAVFNYRESSAARVTIRACSYSREIHVGPAAEGAKPVKLNTAVYRRLFLIAFDQLSIALPT